MGRNISKVILENFQSHSFTEVDFGDFNAIIGPSDNGKTAIMRAIIWALYNNPSGDSFIRKGESTCQVTVLFDDGSSIVKTRTPKSHSYDLYQPGLEPLHLEAFGVGPVEEVVAFHRMGFVDLFGERKSLNVCEQLEQPFFLGESPATKALIIGKLGNTEVIDKAIKNNATEIRELKAEQRMYKSSLKEVKSELKELKNLDKTDKAIEVASIILDKIKVIEQRNQNIAALSSKIEERLEKAEELTFAIKSGEGIDDVISSLNEAIECERRLNLMRSLSDKIKANEIRMAMLKKDSNIDTEELLNVIISLDECVSIISHVDSIKRVKLKVRNLEINLEKTKELASKYDELQELLVQLGEATKIINKINSLNAVKEKLEKLKARQLKGEIIIKNLDKDCERAVGDYKTALVENEQCPICMQKLSENSLGDIDKYI